MNQKKLTAYQKKALNMLIDKYEGSKTYTGENKVNQTFSITPDQVYPDYYSNYAPIDQVHSFEDQIKALAESSIREKGNIRKEGSDRDKGNEEETEAAGVLLLSWKRESLKQIILSGDPEKIRLAYQMLGRSSRNDILDEEERFFRNRLGRSEISDAYCRDMLERNKSRKKLTDTLEEEETLLNLLDRILHNREDILERELSIAVFGDSKAFEKNWRSKVCRILEKYGTSAERLAGIDNRREREMAILEEFGVYANPSYIYMKGNGKVTFTDGTVYLLQADKPVAFSSGMLPGIDHFQINDPVLMTVENLTSFNRIRKENVFFLYLAGYHNTTKQKLLMKINADNKLNFYHFGDIDPDGFLILEHLKKETEIPFQPYHMGTAELVKYWKYCKPLEQNDRKKAENLLAEEKYPEQIKYMLEHNCKLEQEIISWEERAKCTWVLPAGGRR